MDQLVPHDSLIEKTAIGETPEVIEHIEQNDFM